MGLPREATTGRGSCARERASLAAAERAAETVRDQERRGGSQGLQKRSFGGGGIRRGLHAEKKSRGRRRRPCPEYGFSLIPKLMRDRESKEVKDGRERGEVAGITPERGIGGGSVGFTPSLSQGPPWGFSSRGFAPKHKLHFRRHT
ncbi:hypothetical protein Taro_037139 [Colocasia esculenta]|uniref:Uncharacterized protein n=1 Tax=Colocasia esculenta TaxID=4460 RepID=A0A843W3C8_COLES|nr:hypothetical protein [Colocasia esculenta]